jgi:hypothetical protein
VGEQRLQRIDLEKREIDLPNTFDFMILHENRKIPGAVWLPLGISPKALVLVGHGGSQHKRHSSVLELARVLTESYLFAVAAIDGPVHGARRSVPAAMPKELQREFLASWKTSDGGTSSMLDDWKVALSSLLNELGIGGPVGYTGISMGTAYGLPLIANEGRIVAAVIGMWSADYPNSAQLISVARVVRCPILFIQRQNDELFSYEGSRQLFDALGTNDKRLLILPGKHVESKEQFSQTAHFLGERLSEIN